jgi:hypothetical protein
MRDRFGHLNCKPEAIGTLFMPYLHGCKPREPVKGYVYFQRIEVLAIKLEPPGLRKFVRVKDFFPVFVMKSRAADPPFDHADSVYWMRFQVSGIRFQVSGIDISHDFPVFRGSNLFWQGDSLLIPDT